MAEATFFVQECPTCGRNLQIRVEYLGRTVVCQHCHRSLIARDPDQAGPTESGLLARAAELIKRVEGRSPPDLNPAS